MGDCRAEARRRGRSATGFRRNSRRSSSRKFRYRPGDQDVAPLAPVTRANGVDPAQPRGSSRFRNRRVLARIKAAWREDRKPANVMLVVDVSGSMNDEDKIAHAT